LKEEKISSFQVIAILLGYLLGTAIVSNAAAESGADAWFSMLVTIAAALIISCMTVKLAKLHPGKSLVEILISCFGSKAGRIIGFSYVLFLIYLSSAVLLTFCYYEVVVNYQETPTLFISICYMMVIAFIVKMGLEVIGRISEVLVVLVLLITALALFSLIQDYSPDVFLPMFKDGIAKPAKAGIMNAVLPFSEIFLAINILPNHNDQKKASKVIFLAVLITWSEFSLFTLRNIGVLGIEVAARTVYPSELVYKLFPGINISFLLNANVIISGVIKVALLLYSEVKILGDVFGMKDFKIFILPFAAIDIVESVSVHKSNLGQLAFASTITPLILIPFLIIMPLIMMTVSLIKKGRHSKADGNKYESDFIDSDDDEDEESSETC